MKKALTVFVAVILLFPMTVSAGYWGPWVKTSQFGNWVYTCTWEQTYYDEDIGTMTRSTVTMGRGQCPRPN